MASTPLLLCQQQELPVCHFRTAGVLLAQRSMCNACSSSCSPAAHLYCSLVSHLASALCVSLFWASTTAAGAAPWAAPWAAGSATGRPGQWCGSLTQEAASGHVAAPRTQPLPAQTVASSTHVADHRRHLGWQQHWQQHCGCRHLHTGDSGVCTELLQRRQALTLLGLLSVRVLQPPVGVCHHHAMQVLNDALIAPDL
jgi:hypothetical protein